VTPRIYSWYSMPAILKGYIDRVFATGFAFRYSKRGPIGLLNGKRAYVYQTAVDPEEALLTRDLVAAMRNGIDVGVLEYCGLQVMERKLMPSIHHVSDDVRAQHLSDIRQSLRRDLERPLVAD
jgi:NAD(P)H dehydrogenase (quinone)